MEIFLKPGNPSVRSRWTQHRPLSTTVWIHEIVKSDVNQVLFGFVNNVLRYMCGGKTCLFCISMPLRTTFREWRSYRYSAGLSVSDPIMSRLCMMPTANIFWLKYSQTITWLITHTLTLDPIKATADTHLLNLVSKLTCKHILLTHTDHLIAHVYVCSPLFNLFSRLDLQTQWCSL